MQLKKNIKFMKVHLRFFKTMTGYKGPDETGFVHETYITNLPNDGEYFEYGESTFDDLDEKKQKQFKQYGFSVGSYYVAGIKDYRNGEVKYDIDYSIYLIQDKEE
jgi:hypothetical protein